MMTVQSFTRSLDNVMNGIDLLGTYRKAQVIHGCPFISMKNTGNGEIAELKAFLFTSALII